MLYSAIRTFVDGAVPGTAPNYTTLRDTGIQMAVTYASPEFREETYQDFDAPDGQTTRYAVTGRDVKVLDAPEMPTATGINTAGLAAPTGAPSLAALGSGGSLVAGLYYWGICYVTARGDTQMSPLASVQVVTNGRITRAAVALPTNVTGIKDFVSYQPMSAATRLNGAGAVLGTALTITAAPASSNALPFVDHTGFESFTPVLALEPGVDVDGTANAAVTTLTLTTAPTAGQRFRVWYTRRPIPPVNASDTINLPDGWLQNASLFYACQLLGLAHESGDATRFAQVAAALGPIILDLKQRGSGRASPTIIASSWTA